MIKKYYTFIKAYKDNDSLRKSFNELADKTFGISFEQWYQNGYWKNQYIPYSFIDGEKVISNVSVNVMKFIENGIEKNYIQIGTVMTDNEYRNQGLCKQLMQKVLFEYEDQVDGIFLFANDSVLDFYPKFGFKKNKEYQYIKEIFNEGDMTVKKVSMEHKKDWALLEDAIEASRNHSAFDVVENPGLIMFYVTNFMKESVYYIEELNAYIIAEIEEGELLIHNIFSDKDVDLASVMNAFGKSIHRVVLGFTPVCTEGLNLRELKEEDTTLFLLGKDFDSFEEKELMFPTLSHT